MPLSLAESIRVIQATISKSEQLNIKITTAVCDPGGRLIAFHRMDGAIWITVYRSQGKAVTSAAYGRSTASLARAAQAPDFPTVVAMEGTHMIFGAGGLPLFRNGEQVGSVGVSGGTDEEDVECAQAGVDAL